jgi:hypothetical protein
MGGRDQERGEENYFFPCRGVERNGVVSLVHKNKAYYYQYTREKELKGCILSKEKRNESGVECT